jgi:hypothetical protein
MDWVWQLVLGLAGLFGKSDDLSCMIYPKAYEFLDGSSFTFSLRYYHSNELLVFPLC